MRSFEKYLFYILLMVIGFIIGSFGSLDGKYVVLEHGTSLTELEGMIEDTELQSVTREVRVADIPFAPVVVETDNLAPPPSVSSVSTSSDEEAFVQVGRDVSPARPPHRLSAPPAYSSVAPAPTLIARKVTVMEEVPISKPYKIDWSHHPIILRSGEGKSSNGVYIGQEIKIGHTPSKKQVTKPSGKSFHIAHPIHLGFGGRVGVYFNQDLLAYIRLSFDYHYFIIKTDTDKSVNIFSLSPGIGIDYVVGESTFIRVCAENVFHSTTFKKTPKIKNHSNKCFYIGIGSTF